MLRSRRIAFVAAVLLVVSILTVVTRHVAGPIHVRTGGGQVANAWLTVWPERDAVVPGPGVCDVMVDCDGWILGDVTDGAITIPRDRAVLNAGLVWQVAVSNGGGSAGAIVEPGATEVEVDLMDDPTVESANRRFVVRWGATDGRVADVVVCSTSGTCFVAAEDRGSTAVTISTSRVREILPRGTEVTVVQVRARNEDGGWWWSPFIPLPEPISVLG